MSDTRDKDRLDADVPDDPEAKTKAGTAEPSTPRHAEGSLDIFDGSAPERAALPDDRPWLAPEGPGVGPQATVDPRANTPEGHDVERNLTDLDGGPGKEIPTGPNHHGIGTTYDQDEKVGGDNDIEQMLHPSGPAKPPPRPGAGGNKKETDGGVGTTGGGSKEAGSGGTHVPPGTELNFNAPKWEQVGSGLPEYKPSAESQQKQDDMKKAEAAERQRKQDEKEAKEKFKTSDYDKDKKGMTDGESGPVPDWVPSGSSGPVVPPGSEVTTPVNPDLGGGDDAPTIDPSKIHAGGDDPTITNRDPDYQEASVPSAPPAVKPGDQVSKPVNPDDLPPPPVPPGPPGSGPGSGSGGQPDGRAGVPEVIGAAPAEAALPAAVEPAPSVDQQLAPPDFEGPPAQGAPDPGEAGDGDPDSDGLPG